MTFNALIFGLLVFLGNIYHLNTKNSNFGLLVSNTKKRVVYNKKSQRENWLIISFKKNYKIFTRRCNLTSLINQLVPKLFYFCLKLIRLINYNTVNYSDFYKSELPASTTTALATMSRNSMSYTVSSIV